jgi:hypothetical protein
VELGADSVIARRDVVWRDVAGELVIVDAAGKRVMGLNGTGGRLWRRLDGRRSLGELARELAAEHGADAAAVLRDVLAFARSLMDRGLAGAP